MLLSIVRRRRYIKHDTRGGGGLSHSKKKQNYAREHMCIHAQRTRETTTIMTMPMTVIMTIVVWWQSWWRQCTIDTNIVGGQISLDHRVARLTRCRGNRITGRFRLPGNFQGITGNYLSMISITQQSHSHIIWGALLRAGNFN